ncbi:Peroxisomal membrane protein PAS20 [Smittium culicis]|uniref:Peroxisomal membrane protein PEX13 n=1 Tax=Smittium culicis TaxID=133412 RepID=A0A1R1YBU6_9FUNG|nr:Peroxisomal membrane protein PAS20 [Smittium culicis]
MDSPAKPWEQQNNDQSNVTSINQNSTLNPPPLPGSNSLGETGGSENSTLNNSLNQNSAMGGLDSGLGLNQGMNSYGGLGASPYGGMGTSGYGGYGGGYSSGMYGGGYGSGMYGGGMGGGYGGYGGYGGGMYGGGGYGGYGMNMPQNMGPGGPQSLTQMLDANTRTTFQLVESVVGAFSGFARMLESTYFATHSSFMAVLGVIEQFGLLRGYFGGAIGDTANLVPNAIRKVISLITGKPPAVDTAQLTASGFGDFQEKKKSQLSKKTLFLILALIVGLPYTMTRIIRAIAKRQQNISTLQRELEAGHLLPQKSDPNTKSIGLDFAVALFDFIPQNRAELAISRGEVIAILSRVDIWGKKSEWWRCKNKDGNEGLVPSTYIKILKPGQSANLALIEHSELSKPLSSKVEEFSALPGK